MTAIRDGRSIRAILKTAQERGREVIAGAGKSLYLRASPSGRARWVIIKHMDGKNRERALGPYPDVSLSDARARVADALAALGRDLKRDKLPTVPKEFGKFAAWYFEDHHRPGLSSEKGVQMWRLVLSKHLLPLAHIQVCDIAPADVAAVLRPLSDRPAMLKEVRGKLSIILNAAQALSLTDGNAADWRKVKFHIPGAAVKGRKAYKSEHRRAMALSDIPAFIAYLQGQGTTAATCLEWLILTTTRSNEARGALASELDLENGVWTIRAERMKKGRAHRVPLCPRALAIAAQAKPDPETGLLFPGRSGAKELSSQTLRDLVAAFEIQHTDPATPRATVHGFRACFGMWGQRKGIDTEILDRQLAHVPDAYLRDDILEIRAGVLRRWCGDIHQNEKAGKKLYD